MLSDIVDSAITIQATRNIRPLKVWFLDHIWDSFLIRLLLECSLRHLFLISLLPHFWREDRVDMAFCFAFHLNKSGVLVMYKVNVDALVNIVLIDIRTTMALPKNIKKPSLYWVWGVTGRLIVCTCIHRWCCSCLNLNLA